MARMKRDEHEIVHSPADLPAFASETEEVEFWGKHAMGDGFFDGPGEPLPLPTTRTPKSKSTSIRLGSELERRLRRLADLKGTTYQTLLKEFVLERAYEEEKRLGVVGGDRQDRTAA